VWEISLNFGIDLDFGHVKFRPVERGKRGKSVPGPHDVWGPPPSLKNSEKGVPDSFFLT